MSESYEVIADLIKTPANARRPLHIYTAGWLRGFFRPEQPAFEGVKATASPNAPTQPGNGVWFFRDNGAGKAQFCVRFPSGAVQILATEP